MLQIDKLIPEHVKFLDRNYQEGIFIASGRKNPRTGGMIIANAENIEFLKQLIKEDPFYQNGLAEYSFTKVNTEESESESENPYGNLFNLQSVEPPLAINQSSKIEPSVYFVNKDSFFVISVSYSQELSNVEETHQQFLSRIFTMSIAITAGSTEIPNNYIVVVSAKAESNATLEEVLFASKKETLITAYEITEFVPSKINSDYFII